MIAKMLKSAFGLNCKTEKVIVKGLALYLTAGREFFKVEMEGQSFVLVKLSADDRFGAIALQKQLVLLRNAMSCEVAFSFANITKLQREALIAKKIPFVAESDQIYLPFLGIMLRNNLKYSVEVAGKMMPATQCLFLYLLHNNQNEYVLKKDAAEALGLTKTTITRASEQLKAMGLIIEEACGKEIHMKTVKTGYELYLLARPFLVSPVQRSIYTEKNSSFEKLVLAGESALSKKSMLGEPRYKTFAIYKGDEYVKEIEEIDIKWQEDVEVVRLEMWKYNPELFAKEGMVDLVSLALSLSENEDERVQGELERVLEEYEW